jgi:asparagine synthase (glutamine-hydrolysing)
VPQGWRTQLLTEAQPNLARDVPHAVWAETEGAAPLDRLLALNLRTYLLDDLLPKVDRMAMAHGLEVRSPFLDTALAEFVLRLPPRFKVRGLTLKRMLKSVARDLLPKDILGRRKHGFGVPLDSWFRDDLRSYVSSRLCAADARVGEYLDRDAVRALVAEHQGGTDRSQALWALVTLEVFLRREGW